MAQSDNSLHPFALYDNRNHEVYIGRQHVAAIESMWSGFGRDAAQAGCKVTLASGLAFHLYLRADTVATLLLGD